MNLSRSSKRFGFFRRSGKELLPIKPVDIAILPWWIVQLGFITEEDMKVNVDKAEVICTVHILKRICVILPYLRNKAV